MNEQEALQAIALLIEQAEQNTARHEDNLRTAAQALMIAETNFLQSQKFFKEDFITALGIAVKTVLDQQANELKTELEQPITNIQTVAASLKTARAGLESALNWKTIALHAGIVGVVAVALFAALFGFFTFYLPSMDEVKARRTELQTLQTEIAQNKEIAALETAFCNKGTTLCVKVDVKRCSDAGFCKALPKEK
jgi:hypothetical protein